MAQSGMFFCLLHFASVGSVLLLAAAQSSTTYCKPSASPQSPCTWTGACPVAGCEDTCTLNRERVETYTTLRDRYVNEGTWLLCTELAFMVNITLPGDKRSFDDSPGRRLLEQDAKEDAREALLRFKSMMDRLDRMQDPVLMMNEQAGNGWSSGRRLQQLLGSTDGAGAPAAAPTGATNTPPEDIPPEFAVVCPTQAVVDEQTLQIVQLSTIIKDIFQAFIDGKPFSSEQAGFSFVLEQPGRFVKLLEYFEDPAKLAEYVQTSCMNTVVGNETIAQYGAAADANRVLADNVEPQELLLCTDNGDDFDRFHYGIYKLVAKCRPPFGMEPRCYDALTTLHVLDSSGCVDQAIDMFASPPEDEPLLREISTANQQLHAACTSITEEKGCKEAFLNPELLALAEKIDKLMERMAFRNATPFAEQVYQRILQNDTLPLDNATEPTAAAAGPAAGPASALLGGGATSFSGNEEDDVTPAPIIEGDGEEEETSDSGDSGGDGGGGVSVGAIVGPVVGVCLLIVAAVIAAVVIKQRRKRVRAKFAGSTAGGSANYPGYGYGAPPMNGGPFNGKPEANGKPGAVPPQVFPPPLAPLATANAPSSFGAMSTPGPGVPPGGGFRSTGPTATPSAYGAAQPSMYARSAPGDATRTDYSGYGASSHDGSPTHRSAQTPVLPSEYNGQVCAALDMMHSMKQTFAGRYEIKDPTQRFIGSHGIVQVAHITHIGDAAVLKFFTDQAAFAAEQAMYGRRAVADVVGAPPAFMPNADRAAATPYGFVFPPFIVMEKGEPLDEYLTKYTCDHITSMQVLGQVAKAVCAIHKEGYTHRNIKPSNILRRPKQHDWVLSDFASSARIGTIAPLPNKVTSLYYTAPEVILNVRPGPPPSAAASEEADMWALGVVAFEVLTGERAFPPGTPPEAVRAALSGHQPLPWEDGAEGAEERRAKLRGMRRIVLPCLERDASKRPRAEALLKQWWHMFDVMKTQGTFDSDAAQAADSTRGDPPTA